MSNERGGLKMNTKPVACCPGVFDKEQLQEYKKNWGLLEKRRFQTLEIEDGLEFQFSSDNDTLQLLFQWISFERQCCAFLTFTVIVANKEEPVILQLTGTEDAKSYLKNEFQNQISVVASIDEVET